MRTFKTLKYFGLSLLVAAPMAFADNYYLPPLPLPVDDDDGYAEPVTPATPPPVVGGVVTPGFATDLKSLEAHLYRADQKAVPYFKTVVLPIDGFMVQGIPQRNVRLYPAHEVLQIRTSRGRPYAFHITEGASDVIEFLARQKVEIKFFTLLDEDIALPLLDAFFIPGLGLPLTKIGHLKIADGTFKITTFGDANKTLLVINDGVRAENSDQVIGAGPVFYAFPSFADAKSNYSSSERHHFPKDQDAYDAEKLKAFRILFALSYVNKTDKATYLTRMAELNKISSLELAEFGKELLAGTFTRLQFGAKTDPAGTVISCHVIDRITGKIVQDTSLADCDDK
jgi:hypothetical protein